MFGRRKRGFDSADLYQRGFIILRPENLYSFVYQYDVRSVDHQMLRTRIAALLPDLDERHQIHMMQDLREPALTFFLTSSWKARLAYVARSDNGHVYQLSFTDPTTTRDGDATTLMNVLLTAIEKAFLLEDRSTVLTRTCVAAADREFEVLPEMLRDPSVFDIGEMTSFSPDVHVIGLVRKLGRVSKLAVDDEASAEVNRFLDESGQRTVGLMGMLVDTPALPDCLRDA